MGVKSKQKIVTEIERLLRKKEFLESEIEKGRKHEDLKNLNSARIATLRWVLKSN